MLILLFCLLWNSLKNIGGKYYYYSDLQHDSIILNSNLNCTTPKEADPTPIMTTTTIIDSEDFNHFNPLLRLAGWSADFMWDKFIEWNFFPNKDATGYNHAFVVEIGAWDCTQSINAAKIGFKVLVFEPSPPNYKRCFENIGSTVS